MIEYDEDEEFDGDEAVTRRRSRRFKLSVGALLILIAGLATTVAANISINSKKNTEFGQGIFSVKACDSWIGVSLLPSATQPDSNIYVQQIRFYGLDAIACQGTNLQLQLFKSGQTLPLDLFKDVNGANTNRVLLHIGTGVTQSTRWSAITLINGAGTNIGQMDNYEFISYDSSNGTYTWAIWYQGNPPLAKSSDVNSVVLQSTSY